MYRKVLVRMLLLVLALQCSVAVVAAQGPASPLQGPLGSAFSYQGQLKKAGVPVNDTCSFQFSLWSDAVNLQVGKIGPTQTRNGVTVANGLFSVPDLDFGASAFNGDERWLQIAVQCTGETTFTLLTPRQLLTAVPYALSLRPGATINGLNNLGSFTFNGGSYAIGVQGSTLYNHTAFGGGFEWLQAGGQLQLSLMQLDGNGLNVNAKLSASTNSPAPGAAVRGSNAGSGYGVVGQSNVGSGVFGEGRPDGHGVIGSGNADDKSGVLGLNDKGGFGVSGIANGCGEISPCIGVRGEGRIGVRGTSSDPFNAGVLGENSTGGIAMEARGNTTQTRTAGGWVKAMTRVFPNASLNGLVVTGCYNSQLVIGTPPCNFTGAIPSSPCQTYEIDFNFRVNDRFISAVPIVSGSDGVFFTVYFTANPNVVGLRVFQTSSTLVCPGAFVIVY